MDNIWEFLFQTISVSLVAGFLLAVKWIMADKLSPRWQYGVWIVLAVRLVWPADIGRQVVFPYNLYFQELAAAAERRLHSGYASCYLPVSVTHIFPYLPGRPVSAADWLFFVYVLGVFLFLAGHFLAYFRLLGIVKRGMPAGKEQLEHIGEKYRLKVCEVKKINGISTAFVCGIFHPVLVVPAFADSKTEEKVLLHELLHVKYHDALQSMFWCVLHSFHWCNPFLCYVFRRIENDMESLCDQRVLELLEGEERREYGICLLSMADETYARAPGTTSISNGGKNIKRRIEAIARFRKYPKEMRLISICMIFVMGAALIQGSALEPGQGLYLDWAGNERTLGHAIAASRIIRCRTAAAALDTYAKGLILENGSYLSTALPLAQSEKIYQETKDSMQNPSEEGMVYQLRKWGIGFYNTDRYYLINVEEVSEDMYQAVLIFQARDILEKYQKQQILLVPKKESIEEGHVAENCILVPVVVRRVQERGYSKNWVVEQKEDVVYCGNSCQELLEGWSGIEAIYQVEQAYGITADPIRGAQNALPGVQNALIWEIHVNADFEEIIYCDYKEGDVAHGSTENG